MGPRGRPPSVVTWFVNLYAATLWQLYYIIIHIYNKPTYLRLHRKSHRNPDLFGWFFNPPWDTLRTIRRWWSETILDSSNMVLLGNPHWSIWKIAMWIKTSPLSFHGPWKIICTLWLFNIAMENSPFVDDFPITTSIYKGFSMAMLNNQVVNEDVLLPWLPGKHNKIQWFFQTAYLSCQL